MTWKNPLGVAAILRDEADATKRIPVRQVTLAFVGYGNEAQNTVIGLTYN